MIANYLQQLATTPTKYGPPPRAGTIRVHKLHLLRQNEESFNVNAAKTYCNEIAASKGASYVNQALAALDGLIQYLADEGKITESELRSWRTYARKVRRPWRRTNKHDKYLPPGALQSLMDAIFCEAENTMQRDRDCSLLGIVLLGPSRVGEVLQLKLENISLVSTTETTPGHYRIQFPADIAKNHQEHDRFIFAGHSSIGRADIFDCLTSYLRWRRELGTSGALFVRTRQPHNTDEISPQNVNTLFKRYCSKAGIHATPHWLRHTFGELTAGRMEMRDLRQMYSHSDESTTRIYTDHDNPERMLEAHMNAASIITDRTAPNDV